MPTEVEELAVYVAAGELILAERTLSAGQMAVLDPRTETVARATQSVRLMLIGGQRLDGKRLIWWNFVATSRERIEGGQACLGTGTVSAHSRRNRTYSLTGRIVGGRVG